MRRLIDNGNRPITPKPHIGHYGRLRKAYLEQYRHRLYTALVASEKLYPHLAETDRAARDMLDYLASDNPLSCVLFHLRGAISSFCAAYRITFYLRQSAGRYNRSVLLLRQPTLYHPC